MSFANTWCFTSKNQSFLFKSDLQPSPAQASRASQLTSQPAQPKVLRPIIGPKVQNHPNSAQLQPNFRVIFGSPFVHLTKFSTVLHHFSEWHNMCHRTPNKKYLKTGGVWFIISSVTLLFSVLPTVKLEIDWLY